MSNFSRLYHNRHRIRYDEYLADSYTRSEFKDPKFIAYDRRTDTVQIGAGGSLAVERGHWRARWRAPSGAETGASGLYQAGWAREGGVWRIKTEAYAKLVCADPTSCP